MDMAFTRYGKYGEELFSALKKADALKEFRRTLMARAEAVSRDMIQANDPALVHALRGQLSICFELADGALAALEAANASANAEAVDRIPESLR